MSLVDIVLLAAILVVVGLVVFLMVRRRQKGEGCSGCSGCAQADHCPSAHSDPPGAPPGQ